MTDESSNAHELRLNIFRLQSCLAQLWGFQKDFIFIHTPAWSVYPGQWGVQTLSVSYSEWAGPSSHNSRALTLQREQRQLAADFSLVRTAEEDSKYLSLNRLLCSACIQSKLLLSQSPTVWEQCGMWLCSRGCWNGRAIGAHVRVGLDV